MALNTKKILEGAHWSATEAFLQAKAVRISDLDKITKVELAQVVMTMAKLAHDAKTAIRAVLDEKPGGITDARLKVLRDYEEAEYEK